jgi:enolase
MSKIKEVRAIEILDSRGNPTVSAEVELEDGSIGIGYVPSGASTGEYEAHEIHDNDEGRYDGKGVLKAVENVNTKIREAIVGMESDDLRIIDQKMIELDGSKNKSNLGGNSILSVSLAAAKAAAESFKVPLFEYLSKISGITTSSGDYVLPIPMMNILNGGKHAVGSTDFQEFMIVPVNFETFKEALRAGTEVFHSLHKILEERSYQPLVGDEGGYAPSLFSNEQAIELLTMAIKESGRRVGDEVAIALDPAASEFFYQDIYQLHRENRTFTTNELIDFYDTWTQKYPIISIEDPLSQDDWAGYQEITSRLKDRCQIIGDDIYATNIARLKKGIEQHSTTGILIKPNQIGTLTETIEAIKMAKEAGFSYIISHRSGETEDSFIADLSVAVGSGKIKTGAPCRGERTVKYNRLLEIESKLGARGKLAKWGI